MSPKRPELSVIIPTWNGRAMVSACLDSLARQSYTGFETVVVDDGSTDDTADHVRKHYPEVKLVVCPKNRGFVAAVNRGIAESRGQWLFLLNNDVTLAEDCLERLIAQARTGLYGMLAPLVLWTADPRLVYSAGDDIGRNGRPESAGYLAARDTLAIDRHPFGVSGGYGLFHRNLLDQIGLLDPAFGAYFEDSDLCFRARWAGRAACVVPEALAWHEGSATIRNRLWWRTRQCYQNHALLVLKNFSLPMLAWNARALCQERRHQFGRVFSTARAEWGTTRAVGHTFFAWLGLALRVPGALVRRRRVMALRKLTSAQMQALLRGGDRNE